jgi:hypothetical protein
MRTRRKPGAPGPSGRPIQRRPAVPQPVSRQLPELENLKTIRQIVEACPGIQMGTLRGWLLHAKRNGLEAHLYRPSPRLILVDVRGLLEWMSKSGGTE